MDNSLVFDVTYSDLDYWVTQHSPVNIRAQLLARDFVEPFNFRAILCWDAGVSPLVNNLVSAKVEFPRHSTLTACGSYCAFDWGFVYCLHRSHCTIVFLSLQDFLSFIIDIL